MKKIYLFTPRSNSKMKLNLWNQLTNQIKQKEIRLFGLVLLLLMITQFGYSQDLTYKGRMVYKDTMSLSDNVAPTFADVDGDNDMDLYVGNYDGLIEVFTNDGNGNFESAGFLQADGGDLDIGRYSVPVFEDLDGDNDLDLYVGEEAGLVKVFTNNGSGVFSAAGNLQADGNNVDAWYGSVPVFEDLDGDDDLDLYLGDTRGIIHVYLNNGSGVFSKTDSLKADGVNIEVVSSSAPAFADLDDDDDLDLYVGDYEGFIRVFTNNGSGVFSSADTLQTSGKNIDVGDWAKPVFEDLDKDGDLDLYIGEDDTLINVFLNDGSGNLSPYGCFKEIIGEIDWNLSGQYSYPAFGDIDGDDDLDLFIGSNAGNIYAYMNEGTGIFNYEGRVQASGGDLEVGDYAAPTFADLDDDDDLDLYVGTLGGEILIFTNDGTGTFTANGTVQADASSLDAGQFSIPIFADLDNDDDMDLYVGESSGRIRVYINTGGLYSETALFQAGGSELKVNATASPVFEDFDQDNDLDLFVGDGNGYISVFTNDGSGTFSAVDTLQSDGSHVQKTTRSTPVFANLDGSCFPNLYFGGVLGRIYEYTGIDTSDPEITSTHENKSIYANSNCESVLPDYKGDITATDNCDSNLDYTQSPIAGTLISGATNVITLTATDDAGNFDEVTFNVAVVDTTSPEITSFHSNQAMEADASCAILPDYTGDVIADDNCDASLDVVQSPVAGTTLVNGDNFVKLFAIDDAGNKDSVRFNVFVTDNLNPVITSTHNDTALNASGSCEAILPDFTAGVVCSDNCDDALNIAQQPTAGSTILGATNQVTITVGDNGGNETTVSFNVKVEDNTDPVITCASDATFTADSDGNYTVPGATLDATATDNCNGASVKNDLNAGSSLNGEVFGVGEHTINWTVTDNAGNTATCSVTLTVESGSSTGINDLAQHGIKIYPNPVAELLTIGIDNPSRVNEIRIIDVAGRQLYNTSETIDSDQRIDMSNFKSGLYIIQIKMIDKSIATKIIKK